MFERTGCIIPLCKRTTARHCAEWICQKHWIAIPLKMRRLYAGSKRKALKTRGKKEEIRLIRVWKKIVKTAIDRAFP